MKLVAIASGGLDSTVMVYALRAEGHELALLTFDYGQRHRKEIEYARRTARRVGLPHEVVNIADVSRLLRSALTSPDIPVPEGPYAPDTMQHTVVPNRNAIFLSIAAGYALSTGREGVAIAVHAGDHPVYPDCRPSFIEAFERMVQIATESSLRIVAPFIRMNKEDIVALGARLGVPFEDTWSCYRGGDRHCGVCPTCLERKAAFRKAGVEDPTEYEEAEDVSHRQNL